MCAAPGNRLKLRQELVHRDRLDADRVDFVEPCIRGNESIVAVGLQAEAREIDHRDGVRARLAELCEEGGGKALEPGPIDIAPPGHVEAGLLELISDQARVIDSRGFRSGRRIRVSALPDHQSKPRLARG